jgi:outer membrane autotransporter protein
MKKIALAVMAFAAMGAQAADEGAYVGLNYNDIKFSGNASGSEKAVGFYAGYRMGNIGGEIARFQKTTDGEKLIVTDIAAIPRLNVAKDVDLLGKVGIRYSENSGQDDNGSFKDKGTSLVVGAGVEYSVLPQVSVRAMVDYSNKTLGLSGAHATTKTIGVSYKF